MGSSPTFGYDMNVNKIRMYSEMAHYLLICTWAFTICLCFEYVLHGIHIMPLDHNTTPVHMIRIHMYQHVTFFYCSHVLWFFYGYMHSDFSLINTIKHSNVLESLFYKFCGFWGNQDGSFILWIFMGILYGHALILLLQRSKWFYFHKMFFFHYSVFIPWMIFLLFATNPWLKHNFFFKNGLELNPLLQDVVLSIHPPFLYGGYLGFSILFVLSFMILKEKWMAKHTIYWIKYFNILTWGALTIGMSLGSWWAYYELGWGGWWFWDPVENICLIPWLSSTILIHGFLLQKKAHVYDDIIRIIIYLTYVFIWWSTYMIRSGVLTSVHAFVQNAFSAWILFIFTAIFIIYIFYYLKMNYFKIHHVFTFIVYSKEHFIHMAMCILMGVACFICLTLHIPQIMEFFFHKPFSFSPNFYNELFIPLTLPFLIIMVMASFTSWHKPFTWFHLPFNVFIGVFMGVSMFYLINVKDFYSWFQLLFIIMGIYLIYQKYDLFKYIKTFNAMFMAHFAIIIFILIIIFAPYYGFQWTYMIYPGDHINVENVYELIFRNMQIFSMDHYHIWFFDFMIKPFQTLDFMVFTEQRYHLLNKTWTMKPHVLTNMFSDLYMILGKGNLEVGWYLKIIFNPFMAILWMTPFLLLLAASNIYVHHFKTHIKFKDFYKL